MSKRSLGLQTVAVFAIKIVDRSLSLISGIVTSRFLGPEGKGLLRLAQLLPGFISSVGDFGFGSSATLVVARKESRPNEVLSVALASALFFFILYGGALLALFPFLRTTALTGLPYSLFLMGVAAIPLAFLTKNVRNILRGMGLFSAYNSLFVIGGVLGVVSMVIFLVWLNLGVLGALLAALLAPLLVNLFGVWLIIRSAGLPGLPTVAGIRTLAKYGASIQVVHIFSQLNWRLDYLIINWFLGASELGQYSVATTIAEIMKQIPESMGVVLLPFLATEETKKSGELSAFANRTVVTLAVFASLGLAVVGYPLIVLLFGEAFSLSYWPMVLVLPGIVALTVRHVTSSYLNAQGKPELCIMPTVWGLVANTVADIVLIPLWGIKGAAIASSLGYLVGTGSMVRHFVQLSGIPTTQLFLVSKADLIAYRRGLNGILSRIRARRAS